MRTDDATVCECIRLAPCTEAEMWKSCHGQDAERTRSDMEFFRQPALRDKMEDSFSRLRLWKKTVGDARGMPCFSVSGRSVLRRC